MVKIVNTFVKRSIMPWKNNYPLVTLQEAGKSLLATNKGLFSKLHFLLHFKTYPRSIST